MNLITKQKTFSTLVARLILHANDLGFDVTFGEAERPAVTAKHYKEQGIGSENSAHRIRLAVDLNLFKRSDGHYCTATEDHKALGEWWEAQSGEGFECAWGGRFGDGNHYSIRHNNVR